jgi:hypothetical protein
MEETPMSSGYEDMTVKSLRIETTRRGLALTNLRNYKRDELLRVLVEDDQKERAVVLTRYPDARIKYSGMYFVVVTGLDHVLTLRRDSAAEAWEEAAEDVRRLDRDERHQQWEGK